MSKKGISPLISVTLLIVFVITLSVIISHWISNDNKQTEIFLKEEPNKHNGYSVRPEYCKENPYDMKYCECTEFGREYTDSYGDKVIGSTMTFNYVKNFSCSGVYKLEEYEYLDCPNPNIPQGCEIKKGTRKIYREIPKDLRLTNYNYFSEGGDTFFLETNERTLDGKWGCENITITTFDCVGEIIPRRI